MKWATHHAVKRLCTRWHRRFPDSVWRLICKGAANDEFMLLTAAHGRVSGNIAIPFSCPHSGDFFIPMTVCTIIERVITVLPWEFNNRRWQDIRGPPTTPQMVRQLDRCR